MIRLLGPEDRPVVEGVSGRCWSVLRIKALLRAYGFSYDFVRFYANGDGSAVVCVQDGCAAVWAGCPGVEEELAEFLPFAAHTVLADGPLPMGNWRLSEGNVYFSPSLPARRERAVSNALDDGFRVLSQVYGDSINGCTYPQWYADLSHRVRHGVSQIYTLEGACSAVRYCVEEGCIGLVQLATLPRCRGRGLARRLLSHLYADSIASCGMPDRRSEVSRLGVLLQSQDGDSDRFYNHLGFCKAGRWRCYQHDADAAGGRGG